MVDWRPALPLLCISAYLILEELIAAPSCTVSPSGSHVATNPNGVKVMIVSDLLLKGPDAGYFDTVFRYTFISRFFRRSYEKLEPDMLVVLGDIAAKGAELGESGWSAVLRQFYRLIGPFGEIPLVAGLGERDVGECCELDEELVGQIASKLPGLDRTGCAAFEFENVSFVVMNAVALLCRENALRFGVEKLIESESFDLRTQVTASHGEVRGSDELIQHDSRFASLESDLPAGSGPIILLHFPLHHALVENHRRNDIRCNRQSCEYDSSAHSGHSAIIEVVPYDLRQTLPVNETEYILQSLRPRLVISGHAHHYHEYNLSDGTREVIVPSMAWASSGKPGFVLVNLGEKNNIGVSHCSLAQEVHVLMAYLSIFALFLAVMLLLRGFNCNQFGLLILYFNH
ncbi:hypothetical protein AXF42_Ash002059 [Apostasia shenzhenica]|uniref:Calcineurin-like phosphoesterase domain-containing protein n=1 Tax=Apostasia shenzhenica TaxID=1088818 RepID=A0A2I0AMR1_9ASPA|nr:hypothetical protein AXF42_Ash002059 [Apostasia shenzhenica]